MALRLLRSRSASHHHSPVTNLFSPNSSSSSRSLPDRLQLYENRLINGLSKDQRRAYFTATQAAAALRPFYFAVHPDLFGLYPEMYRTNEQSLKALNGYIDGLFTGAGARASPWSMVQHHPGHQPKPITLKFYVRDRKEQKKEVEKVAAIKSVQVNLKERDPCATVRSILETCNLPTGHLPPPVHLPWRAPVGNTMRRDVTVEQAASDEELMQFWASSKKKKRSVEIGGLRNWLAKSIQKAESLRSEYEKLEMDVKKKVDEIKSETGLIDIDFNMAWTLIHCRGCLQLFRKALATSRVPVVSLKGWILKFTRHGTYVSLDRSIVLGVDDLPSDWMSLIHNLNYQQAYYGDLPALEKRLSERLGNAMITGPADTPVRDYRNRLITLIDRLGTAAYRSLGTNLRRLQLVIENDACDFILTESGRISIPCTATTGDLFEFLDQNCQAALDLRDIFETGTQELKELRRECVDKWKLESIDWGEGDGRLSQDSLKSCLERFVDLGLDQELQSILKGHRLHIGAQESYVLMPDGRLSIPYNWQL